MAATSADITSIYNNLLGRAPDASGADYWLKSGMSVDDIANSVRQSDEYKSAWANGAPVYKPEVAPATTSIGSQSSALTPQQARDMIERSMISGVPTSEFNAVGGYDAVAELAKQAGLGGSPTIGSILKYGNTSGSGNQTYMSGGVHNDIGAGYDGVGGNNYYGEAQRAIMEDRSNAGLTLDQVKWKQQQQQSTSATPSMSNTDFNVNELKTAAIADSNNPIVRQAMARAMQSMNGRGLLNSSMATQAAQEAAIAKALEIAAPDTAAYYTDQRDAKQFDYNKQLTKLQGEINFQNSAGLARLNNDLGIANAQAQYDMKVGDVTQTNYITMIDRIQQDTTKQVQQINSSAMPYEEKQAAIRNIQAQAQAQIDNANRLFKSTNGWQDQWAVAADTYSWQVEGAPEKPASTTTTSE